MEDLEKSLQEHSSVEAINMLSGLLIEKISTLSVEDSEARRHKLNMEIKDLEEAPDRVENQKPSKWNPEQNH